VADAKKIRLSYFQCPGDTLVSTGAVECLMRQFPGQFLLEVEGNDAGPIFQNNPHITRGLDGDVQTVRMDNPLIGDSDKRPVHFLESYVHLLAGALGIDLKLTVNRPFVYLSEEEKSWLPQVHELTGKPVKYWVVCSGAKKDYTVKGAGTALYQEVVDRLRGAVQFVQVGLAEHGHKPLEGAIDLRGKTDTRQLIRLCYHAEGGLGGESFLHHLFAALEKPFVCLASGFLPTGWVSYPTTTILTKAPMMSCCDRAKGCCWRSRVVRLGDGDHKDESLCEQPVFGGGEAVPKCLALIRPEEVCTAIRAYYEGGLLKF
jgi:hypothetical protein